MFGTYRLALALAVSAQHLLILPVFGDHALHGFFVLSGFLMTRVLNKTYGYTLPGIRAFLANRALRLYPVYWAILAISTIIICAFGEDSSRQYRHFLYLPHDVSSIVKNITLVFPSWFPALVEPRLSPPSWSLTIEIFYYFLIAAGVSRKPRQTLFWLFFSVVVLGFLPSPGSNHHVHYAHLIAQSLPFALGATLYHYSGHFAAFMNNHLPFLTQPPLLAAITIGHTVAASGLVIFGVSGIQDYATFTNLILQLALITRLNDQRYENQHRSIDQFLGDLTYPVFLLHWQVGFMTAMLLYGQPIRGPNIDGLITYIIAIISSFALSALLVVAIDRPVQKLRAQLRFKKPGNDYPRTTHAA